MCTLIDMKSHRRYRGSWLALSRQKRLFHWRHIPFFTKIRINRELNRIKKRYHLTVSNPKHLISFKPLTELQFPYLSNSLYDNVHKDDQDLFFLAGMLDHLHNGQPFFIGISQRTLEWLDIYLADSYHNTTEHYRFHIFERYWQEQKKPRDAMQIRATINIYLDEILYLVAKNALLSPFRTTLKFPSIPSITQRSFYSVSI